MIEERQLSSSEQISTVFVPELSSRRRSETEVKIMILNAIADGANSLTHIMYRSNTSWGAMSRFVKVLEQQKLIAYDSVGGRKRYALTEKGTRVLHTYNSIANQLGPTSSFSSSKTGSC
ncbi:MAG: winged helix-turn-helix domain-containing protein [Nitrososphaerales archaeon]